MPAWNELPEGLRPKMTGVVLFDKSAIQALSEREMLTVSRHDLHHNIAPVLLREVLGNVAKEFSDGRDAGRMVQSLARKVGGFHSTINMDYQELCAGELLGLGTVPLGRCAIVPMGASLHRTEDGETSMLIDQGQWDAMIYRWQSGKFTEADRAWARQWRNAAYSFRKSMLMDHLQKHRVILPRPSSIADCAAVVDELLGRAALQDVWLRYLVEELNLPRPAALGVQSRWEAGFRFLQRFAPYAHHCMRVILSVTVAARHRLIRWEPTTVVDATYLYYLPFCEFFVSSDHVHERLAPGLLQEPQRFIGAKSLKELVKPLVGPDVGHG
jgi:hypothetical protein